MYRRDHKRMWIFAARFDGLKGKLYGTVFILIFIFGRYTTELYNNGLSIVLYYNAIRCLYRNVMLSLIIWCVAVLLNNNM